MKIPVLCLAVLFPLSWLSAQRPVPSPAPVESERPQQPASKKVLDLGDKMPATFVLKDIDGKEHKAAAYMGRVVVVNFHSITCPIQAAWDPAFAELQEQYGDKGVVFLHVNSNVGEIGREPPKVDGDARPYAEIREHLARKKLPFTLLVDHGNVVADFFQARTTPHAYVFSAAGQLVYKGLVDDDQRRTKGDQAKRYVAETLDTLLKGDPVEPFQTKEAGCSIKRVDAAGGGQRGGRRGGRGQRPGAGGGRNGGGQNGGGD